MPLSAQYFFTGEVKGPHGDNLQHVSIFVRSTGMLCKTGPYGNFEIISRTADDSLTFSIDGYEKYSTPVSSSEFLRVILKELPFPQASKKNNLISVIRGAGTEQPIDGNILQTSLVENPFVSEYATVSFACNSNSISYSNIKRFLDMGLPVPAEAIKLEEMLNYHNFYYEDPQEKDPFHCSSALLSCPWNEAHRLLCLNICAKKAILPNTPPANLVFLIDVTGSMDMPNKLPLVKSCLHLLVRNLRDIDTVSLIEYGGRQRMLTGVPGSNKEQLLRAIEQLYADGPSPGETSLGMAYKVAAAQFMPGGNNRVILITDGDISTAPAKKRDLVELVRSQYEDSIHLSCLGVGMNKDEGSELAILADAGHGSFTTMDDTQQGESAMLNLLANHMPGVADKVCITAQFDTTLVQEYRLLGFENKRSALEDTTLRLEGSSIGSATTQLAMFEIIPKKDSEGIENIARIRIDYCLPGQAQMKKMDYDCPNKLAPFESAPASLKKAVCIALFGMKLKGSPCTAQFSWLDIEKMTKKVFAGKNVIDRDYIALTAKARKVYEHSHNN
ncbi:MAG TPA: von Willebrand factor type A domain-containing protein [Puia sp.]|nr:von Willebrand factor type A domain-containing protein [Puia sp.]